MIKTSCVYEYVHVLTYSILRESVPLYLGEIPSELYEGKSNDAEMKRKIHKKAEQNAKTCFFIYTPQFFIEV